MRTIHKYPLKPGGEQALQLPRGSRVLSAIEQHGGIVVYAEVDDQEPATETHTLYVYGTGFPVTHNGGACRFLSTVKTGPYVFHVYVMGPDVMLKASVTIADINNVAHHYQRSHV